MGDKNIGSNSSLPQAQAQIQEQNEQQAIDQGFSHDILYQLLSTAELFALGNSPNRQYKGYEFFNSSSKSRSKLREQFLIQTDTFKNSYIFFCYDHETYDFPQTLSKENIIKLMTNWKDKVNDIKDKEIYDKTIKLLSKEKNFGSIKVGGFKNNKYNEKDLNDVEMGNLQDVMISINRSNERITENIKKQMKENGKYVGNPSLGAKGPVDPVIAELDNRGNIAQPVPGKTYHQKFDENAS